MKRTPLARRSALRRKSDLARKKKVNPTNRKRRAKLRSQQFGDDGKREFVLSHNCPVTGALHHPKEDSLFQVDPCHVGGTRGAGHGPEMMAPLRRDVHRAFDSSMTDERFAERYGMTRDAIRAFARQLEDSFRGMAA